MGSSTRGLSIAIAGATGAVGREVLEVLEERDFPVRAVRALASPHSVGEDVEFLGESIPVEPEVGSLRHLDLLVLCTPAPVSLDLVREALRAEVSCIDCSGALATSPEVPLLASGLAAPGATVGVPLVSSPGGSSLAWARLLRGLHAAAGVSRVVGTILRASAAEGRAGIETLSSETIALLNQRQLDEDASCFERAVAFDCLPVPFDEGEGGPMTAAERRLRQELPRLLEEQIPLAVSAVQIPTFVGEGATLAVETRRPLSAAEAREVLAKETDVELWSDEELGPTTRDTTGSDQILVGGVRSDPSVENGLLLWTAIDPLRLVASNVVKLAETRLRLH